MCAAAITRNTPCGSYVESNMDIKLCKNNSLAKIIRGAPIVTKLVVGNKKKIEFISGQIFQKLSTQVALRPNNLFCLPT